MPVDGETDSQEAVELGAHDLPSFFRAAETASAQGQVRFLRQTGAQYVALFLAGAAGALSQLGGDWIAWLAGASFIAAATLRLYVGWAREDRLWYEGRAAAESAKTLAWRYGAGGRPFTRDITDDEARREFIRQLADIADTVTHLPIAPSSDSGDEISQRMVLLRAASLDERMRVYREGRLEDQRKWYANRAQRSLDVHRRWQLIVLAIELLGAAAALLIAAGVVTIDPLGALSAVAAGVLAWTNVKQHWNLATAYGVAANELGQAITLSRMRMTESQWSEFVNEAEEAISREHTLWVASRGVLRPLRQ